MAFLSDETGRAETYVRSTNGSPEQWQISTGGGEQPRWRGDGKELFFTTPDGKLMATPIESLPSFRPGAPRALFTLPEPPNRLLPLFEDVTPDGSRFLLNLPTESAANGGFRVVLHWRALVMGEPPSIDANEITDKGYLNQRAVIERRATLVDTLYAGGPDVITL